MPLWKPNDINDLMEVKFWLKPEDFSSSALKDCGSFGDNATLVASADAGTINKKNGVPIMTYSGADTSGTMYETSNTTSGPLDTGTGEFYIGIFCKVKVPALTSGSARVLFAHDTAGNDLEIRMNTSEKIVVNAASDLSASDSTIGDSSSLTEDHYHWLGCRREITDSHNKLYYHRDGAFEIANADFNTSDNMSDARVNIGGRSSKGTVFWKSDLGEMIAYHDNPSDSDLDKIQAYINHKYGNTSQISAGSYASGPPTSCHCVSAQTLSTEDLSSNVQFPFEVRQNLNTHDSTRQ